MNRLLTKFFFYFVLHTSYFVLQISGGFAQLNPAFLKQYTEAHGVPGAEVGRILVDRFGYIWLGTINGLARYDGYEFQRFFSNPNDSTSIEGLIVWSIFEDSKGRIWIGTSPESLNMYDPATRAFRQFNFKHLITRPANVQVGVFAMEEDADGRIYFGISSQYGQPIDPGLLYIDEKDQQIKKYQAAGNYSTGNIYRLRKDKSGSIWFLSFKGLQRIDKNNEIRVFSGLDSSFGMPDEYPTDFTFDNSGHLWLISNFSRLFNFNAADSSFIIHAPRQMPDKSSHFNTMYIDKNQHIWVGGNRGLWKFNKSSGVFEGMSGLSANPVEQSQITHITSDSFGSLWFGTLDKGFFKYEEKAIFTSFGFNGPSKTTLTAGWVNILKETTDGKLLMATSGPANSGLNILDPATHQVESIPYHDFFPSNFGLYTVYEYQPGEFYLSANDGIFTFSWKTKKIVPIVFKGHPVDVPVNKFFKDRAGNLWLCSMRGLVRYSPGMSTYKKYDLSKLKGCDASSNEITNAFESGDSGFWMGTNNGLFFYNSKTDQVERHGVDKSQGDILFSQDVNAISEGKDGIVWIGTWQGGLSRYDPTTKKIRTYTRQDGLASMSIQGILEEDNGNVLWLSTFDGMSRFDISKGLFTNFSISDGIQGQLFADGSMVKTSANYFAFGGSNGVTIFRPEDFTKNSIPPKVYITDLKLFNKSVVPGGKSVLKTSIYETREIILDHDQNNISLDFVAIHYADPDKNKYTYKLENFDDDWREVGNQHVAFYPKLSPGEYIFKVKAANNNGVWNDAGSELRIVVLPPWWRTPWAYVGYFLFLVAAAFVVNRYMRSRVIRKERERSRAKELAQAKEIENAYYSLEKTHETLKATQSQLIQAEKMASLGELTAGIAHEIQNPLNFVNNFSEVNKELLSEMKGELDNGNLEAAKVIAADLITNEEKISHHGKRADSIVKGMLQHSRTGSVGKEPVDLNELADEYLRLAYHGMRGKDNSFNVAMKTDFDPSVNLVKIVRQDVGRVLLNLYNNAFQAIAEKKKIHPGYNGEVAVSTKKTGDHVYITVKDNGIGIPQKIVDKIFQPFFTTKPAGQGTGLGLSLSYDIIQAHNGTIDVNSTEGEGTTFVIRLNV